MNSKENATVVAVVCVGFTLSCASVYACFVYDRHVRLQQNAVLMQSILQCMSLYLSRRQQV